MPFTFAHAAAGLPLRRLPLVWSAFFIGSFAPDFEYFLWLSPQNGYGHHFPGIVYLTFPVAVLTLWAFHAFVREPMTRLLPVRVQQRLMASVREFRWFGGGWFGMKHFLAIIASIALGIATHVFWDSFTHSDTWATSLWPELLTPYTLPLLGTRALVQLLQFGSSVLGMVAVALWAWHWYRNTQPVRELPRRRLSVVDKVVLGGSMLMIASAGGVMRLTGLPASEHTRRYFVVLLAVSVIALIWWQLVALGVLWKTTERIPKG
ncbi:MAG: DUF4184 family protein [Acidobacteriaceae bacterium]